MQQSLFSIRATYIALCFYCVFGAIVGISYLAINTGHFIDFVVPTSSSVLLAGLLLYFHHDPKGRHTQSIKYLFFITAYSFVTPAWYYTIGSVIHNWVLVEVFPPISGVILIAISILTAMVPHSWLRHTMLLWGAICVPILLYLISQPSELSTARGREMMVFFGPGGALLFIVLSYQRDIMLHFTRAEERLRNSRRQADYDELTDICNRRGLIYWLSSNAGAQPNISSIIIDLDHFKQINDSHGHETGDAVLKQAAKLLESSLPKQSCLARWGGDEFVVLMNGLAAEQAKQVADTCWRTIRDHPFPLVGQLTCSLGVATNIQSNDIDTIIRSADACLYIAKRQGRNQVVTQPHAGTHQQ
ncbi:GGDEF domain-containing protein [Marinomonas fungiae]|uniref:GGDEF domain-containing protein n=1 Tax=Marinomonas fungiae TaxID=1137284 RepID=UPI003A94F3BB